MDSGTSAAASPGLHPSQSPVLAPQAEAGSLLHTPHLLLNSMHRLPLVRAESLGFISQAMAETSGNTAAAQAGPAWGAFSLPAPSQADSADHTYGQWQGVPLVTTPAKTPPACTGKGDEVASVPRPQGACVLTMARLRCRSVPLLGGFCRVAPHTGCTVQAQQGYITCSCLRSLLLRQHSLQCVTHCSPQ